MVGGGNSWLFWKKCFHLYDNKVHIPQPGWNMRVRAYGKTPLLQNATCSVQRHQGMRTPSDLAGSLWVRQQQHPGAHTAHRRSDPHILILLLCPSLKGLLMKSQTRKSQSGPFLAMMAQTSPFTWQLISPTVHLSRCQVSKSHFRVSVGAWAPLSVEKVR